LLRLAPMTGGKPGDLQTLSYSSWDALITATFPDGIDDAIFGVRLDATAGFDSAYDLPEPPPPVEPPYVQSFFYYPGNPSTLRRLHRSCIPPEDNMEWPLRVSFSNGTDNVILSWSLENVPASYAVLLYKGEILVADMRAVDNYTFEAAISEYDFTISTRLERDELPPPAPQSVEIPLITPEAPAKVEVENIAVTVLDLSVLDTVENVRIIVRELVDRTSEIAIAAPGTIYSYLEITEDNITDNDLSSVTITFKVEKTWIEGENIDENTITLKRYNAENGEWVSLPTVKVDEDATYVYFSVTSPRLSYFAISGTAISLAPAAFTVSTLAISPSGVSVGEDVSISVMAKNTGELEGTYTVTLEINGAAEAIENVTVAGGSERPVTFTVTEDVEGTYNVEVDGLTGTFTVTKLPPVSTEWPLIAGIVGIVVIIGAAFVFYNKRRSQGEILEWV